MERKDREDAIVLRIALLLCWRQEERERGQFRHLLIDIVHSSAASSKEPFNTDTMVEAERFIPERQKLDQVSLVKDYAAVPRLEYR